MDGIWERLENFLRQNAPRIYEGLAPGAAEEEIAESENVCGFRLPPDVCQSYLRHNGQSDDLVDNLNMGAGGEFIPGYFGLLPISGLVSGWQDNIDLLKTLPNGVDDDDATDPRVKRVYLHPAWVPFASDIGGNRLCLDFDPGPGGTYGQVILFDHEDSMRQVLAPGLAAWLNIIVSDLEAGRLVWNEELMGFNYPEDDPL